MKNPAGPPERVDTQQSLHGKWWDEVYTRDPITGESVLRERTPVKSNIICLSISELMAGLFANDARFFGGILFHAFGAGQAAWDTSPANPSAAQTSLVDELYRKTPTNIDFLDESGNPTSSITKTLRIKTVLDYGETEINDKYIREQGLFGGDAVSAKDSGHIIDAINHVKIWKDSTIRLIRYIELGF
jgi:hypothetical protein